MKQVRVVVAGYGYLGKWHTEKAAKIPSAHLVGIVEPNPANRKAAAEKYPDVKIAPDFTSLGVDFDAAVLVTPTSTHFALLKELLKAGKHVFCEKPLCDRAKDAEEIAKLAEGKSTVLQVGHSERMHEAWEIFSRFPDMLEGPVTVRANRVAAFKGRATDVDVVSDLMIHDLDLLQYLLKGMPQSVWATGYKQRTATWDHVLADCRLPLGKRALITVSRGHVKEIRDIEITGPKGCLYADLVNCEVHVARADNPSVEVIKYAKRDHLFLEHEAFYRSILEKTPVAVTCLEGLRAVMAVDLVLESLKTGREVVL